MDVIETLRIQAAQDAEALRARTLMIDILEESVKRWRLAGYAPTLELGDCGALVRLRLDTSVWALQQIRQVSVPEAVSVPAPVVDAALCRVEPPEAVPAPVAGPAEVKDRRDVTIDYSDFWTPEKDQRVLKLRGEGLSVRKIAAELGTSMPAVEKRLWKMRRTGHDVPPPQSAGFPSATWTPEREAKLIELRAAGRTTEEIAAELGATIKAIGARVSKLRREGHDMPEATRAPREHFATPTVRVDGAVLRAWTDQDDAVLASGYNAGRKLSAIAQDLDRSFSAVNSRLQHLRETGAISHRRNIAPGENPWSDAQRQELRDLWPVMKVADICARLGVSKGAISGMAHRMKLGPAFRGVEQKSEPQAVVPEAAPLVLHKASAVGKSTDLSKHGIEKDLPAVVVQQAVVSLAVKAAPVVVPNPVAATAPKPAPASAPKMAGGVVLAVPRTKRVDRPDPIMMDGLTRSQKEKLVTEHLEHLPNSSVFDAEMDLELCEAVFAGRGGLPLFATDMGLDHGVVAARFESLVAVFRAKGVKALPIDTAGLLLPALRDRVKASRGVVA